MRKDRAPSPLLVQKDYLQSNPDVVDLPKSIMNTIAKFTTKHARWITPVFFGLAFYTFGASMMDSFVVYHTWRFVGDAEFVKMHIASGSRIVPFFVIPTLIMTVFLTAVLAPAKRRVEGIGMDCSGLYNYSMAFLCIHSNSDANRIRQRQK